MPDKKTIGLIVLALCCFGAVITVIVLAAGGYWASQNPDAVTSATAAITGTPAPVSPSPVSGMSLSPSPSSAGVTPSPTASSYSLQDFVVYTAPGTDLPGQPITGTVAECKVKCSANSSCVGFSRAKNAAIDVSNSCWLKQNISNNRMSGQQYQTYVK